MVLNRYLTITLAISSAANNNSYTLRKTKKRQLQVDLPNSTPSPSSTTNYPTTPGAITLAPTLDPTSIPRDDKSNQTTGKLSKNKNEKSKKKENKLGSLFTKKNIITAIVILLCLKLLHCTTKKYIQNKKFKRFEQKVIRETEAFEQTNSQEKKQEEIQETKALEQTDPQEEKLEEIQETKALEQTDPQEEKQEKIQEVAKMQLRLALQFYHGKGTTKNNEQALRWFTKSAKNKNAEAQYHAGLMHHSGEGTNKDISKAFKYYKDSAEQGNANAQYAVGHCCNNEVDETLIYDEELNKKVKDYKKMFESWKKSAEQSHTMAQYRLGQCYLVGEGTPKNYEEAFKWHKKAAKQRHDKSQHILGDMYANGEGTTKNLQKAFKWHRKAAKQGHDESQHILGLMYYHGDGTTQNYQKAFKWVKKSAKQGNAQAQHNLGFMYYHGKGTSKNYQKAYTHFLIYDYLEQEKHTTNKYLNKLEQKLTPQAIINAQNEADKIIQGFK